MALLIFISLLSIPFIMGFVIIGKSIIKTWKEKEWADKMSGFYNDNKLRKPHLEYRNNILWVMFIIWTIVFGILLGAIIYYNFNFR
jgi:O-antigen/teichoic acid export membrane protein